MRSAAAAASLNFSTAARLPILVFVLCACPPSDISFSKRCRWASLWCGGVATGERASAEEGSLCTTSAGRQLAPLWPSSFRATTWHSRLQNQALRHRPQSSSLAWLLPHASHVACAIVEALWGTAAVTGAGGGADGGAVALWFEISSLSRTAQL